MAWNSSRTVPRRDDDWLQAISGSERWIHLDNYIFQNDATGQRFAEALCEGLRGCARPRPPRLVRFDGRTARILERLRHAGVEVRAVAH